MVEISHLKKYFKNVKAVDDISFSIKEGQLFAFLGLNGAGKSTTINIICNTLEKDSGEVKVNGINIEENMGKIKPLLGVVYQNSVLDAKLSVYDNLKFRGMLYGLSKSEFEERLKNLAVKLEFSDILKRPLNKLSGGQQRRIDIARALLHNPKLLILDEPTTGLDPKTRILVWTYLKKLIKTTKLTVLLTTHYMEEASEADYVVIMDSGKIVASDTPNGLKNKYAYDFVKIYNPNDDLLKMLEKSGYKYIYENKMAEVEVKNTEEAKALILKFGDLISDFEVVKGRMDNVFLNVTGRTIKELL